MPGQAQLPAAAPAPHHPRLPAAVPLAQQLPAVVPLAQRLPAVVPLAQLLPAVVPLAQRLQLVLHPLPEAQALEAALRLGYVRLPLHCLQLQQPPPQPLLLLPQRREN